MILITGGTGVLGCALVKKIAELGEKIRLLVLPDDKNVSKNESPKIEIWIGNVAEPESIKDICVGITTVIHLAAVIVTDDPSVYTKVNVGGTENLLHEAAKAGVNHFIHVSSASVVYPKPTAYSLSKRKCEALVQNSGIPWTIIRPTLVYDSRGGLELNMFLRYLDKFPIVPIIGSGLAIKRPVFTDDIVDGLVKVAQLPHAANKIYNFSGKESISMVDFSRLCLSLMGEGNKLIIHIPLCCCILLSQILKRISSKPVLTWSSIAGVTQDADLDPSDAISEIGFSPSPLSGKLPQCFPRKSSV